MRLNWEDFYGDVKAIDAVKMILNKWDPGFKHNGIGIEFAGPLGIGKTFAAATIGKELVKLDEDVLFIQFQEVLNALRYEKRELLDVIEGIKVLILDEVVSPPVEQLRTVFAERFEYVVRMRTNHNCVTIMTTNLSDREIEENYERVYSLLSAKQIRVDMTGSDARRGPASDRNLSLLINGELAPIT